MSDVEKSFGFLHENIPAWLKSIAEIQEKVDKMHEQLAKMPIARAPPMRRRTGSNESIRDLDAIMGDLGSPNTVQHSLQVNRKRKTPSLLSGNASGPIKYRSRSVVAVYYDGQIQSSFEMLVRSVGIGRNMLRKGKMAAKMQALARISSSDSEDDEANDDDGSAASSRTANRRRLVLLPRRSQVAAMRNGWSGSDDGRPGGVAVDLFDTTDKALEQAQSLCERAAHQSLRDGDCRRELEGVGRYLQQVLEITEKEVANAAARRPSGGETTASESDAESTSTSTLVPSPTMEPKQLLPDVKAIPPWPPVSEPTTVDIDIDIEVDDDDDADDVPFTIPPVRLTSRMTSRAR